MIALAATRVGKALWKAFEGPPWHLSSRKPLTPHLWSFLAEKGELCSHDVPVPL